jgi:hypothetical protein
MYEETALGGVKPELAFQQAISTIAHEGAHQILHNIGVQQRLSVWPMWISEGLAEYYAPTTVGRKLKWKGAGEINDLRIFEMELYLKARESDQAEGQIVENTVQAARLTSTGYAAAWSLTHYLARMQRDVFNAYVRDVSRLGPLQTCGEMLPTGVVPANLVMFHKHFGSDSADMENRVVQHLKGLPYRDPFAELPHYVAMIAVPGKRRTERDANLFHSQELAEKWINERMETLSEELRSSAQSQVQRYPNRVVAEQYARRWLGGR